MVPGLIEKILPHFGNVTNLDMTGGFTHRKGFPTPPVSVFAEVAESMTRLQRLHGTCALTSLEQTWAS
jgi:hypothetical protein